MADKRLSQAWILLGIDAISISLDLAGFWITFAGEFAEYAQVIGGRVRHFTCIGSEKQMMGTNPIKHPSSSILPTRGGVANKGWFAKRLRLRNTFIHPGGPSPQSSFLSAGQMDYYLRVGSKARPGHR